MSFDNEKSFCMAERLKNLREQQGLSHEKLSKALQDKYDIKVSSDSLMNYEVRDASHAKALKNQGMRVEYLRCLADFYGVSTDYILGYNVPKTPNTTVKEIIKLTGLSEDIVLRLIEWNKEYTSTEISEERDYEYIKEIKEDLSFVKFPNVFKKSVIDFANIILGVYIEHPRIPVHRYQSLMYALEIWYSALMDKEEHDIYCASDDINEDIAKYGLLTVTAEDAASHQLDFLMEFLKINILDECKRLVWEELDNNPHQKENA